MIGKHCGQRVLYPYGNNPVYFKVRCAVCGKVFKQHKRRSKKVQVR